MINQLPRLSRLWICGICASLSMALPVIAVGEPDSTSWAFGGEIYLWGAGIGGTTVTGDDIDISFSDILKNLDMAFMASLAARKGKWSVFGDFIYLHLEEDFKTTAEVLGHPGQIKVDANIKNVISTLGGAYRVLENSNTSLDALAGARYLRLKLGLEAELESRKAKVSDSSNIWDGVVGLRGKTDINEKWYLTYYVDVGTGTSDLTWQALAGINYRFAKVDAVLGYRYLDWEFDDEDLLDDLNVKGPFAGVKFGF